MSASRPHRDRRRRIAVGDLLFLIALTACGPESVAEELAGTYAYAAQGALTCTEAPATNIPPYQCTCQAPGHHEGTLILRNDGGKLAGELTFSTCDASNACGSPRTVGLAPSGQTITRERLTFYLDNDSFYGGSGSWSHSAEGWTIGSIQGRHVRRDGSLRGCGEDDGVFTAVRQ